MEIYPGAHLIECEVGGRPLYLTLLLGEREALLLDCGTRFHAAEDVPRYLAKVALPGEALTLLVITHPDIDHSGGSGEMIRRYPHLRIACGAADRPLIESPERLFSFRYNHYRQDHDIFYDEQTAAAVLDSCSGATPVFLGLTGGETPEFGFGPPSRGLTLARP